MRINEVLQARRAEVVTIEPDATVRDLVALLAEHNIGALVVSTDGSPSTGIVSERDVVRRLNDDDERARRHVATIMTSRGRTVRATDERRRPDDS